jgi:ABC-type lipoprotein export system ATPase subunit
MNSILQVKDISKQYFLDKEVVFTALKNINLTVNKGDFISLVGPSGCGKSTLMHIIGLLDRPTTGQVLINNQDVYQRLDDEKISILRNEFVGFVFQQFNLINKLTILENILLPTIYARKTMNYDPQEKALALMKRFGIAGKERSYPNKISGGQQQRAAIARALIMNPQLILADEPTGNLDSKSGEEILNLLLELNHNDNITVIIVTHDYHIAKKAKSIIKLKDGEII